MHTHNTTYDDITIMVMIIKLMMIVMIMITIIIMIIMIRMIILMIMIMILLHFRLWYSLWPRDLFLDTRAQKGWHPSPNKNKHIIKKKKITKK